MTALPQLLGGQEPMLLIADDQRFGTIDGFETCDGLLQHRRFTAEGEKLLRAQLPR